MPSLLRGSATYSNPVGIVLLIKSYSSDPRDVLHLDETPVPPPNANQVLLRVHTVALNPACYKTMKGFLSVAIKKPAIPEMDCAGTVVAVGKDVKGWTVGDQAFGIVTALDMFRKRTGAMAEYTTLSPDHMFLIC